VERSSYRYEPRPKRNAALREDLVKLARQKPRYGYRRLHALLSRRGHQVNVKRVYRRYVEEGLTVRRRKRKRLVRDRAAKPRLSRARIDSLSSTSKESVKMSRQSRFAMGCARHLQGGNGSNK
jgi:hypothetical protein